MKPRRKHKPRRALTQEERIARFAREDARRDRDLARRIAAWAKTWETCVLLGCRRNSRCLHEDACRMQQEMDEDWPPEDVRIQIYEAIQRLSEADDPAPKYDDENAR